VQTDPPDPNRLKVLQDPVPVSPTELRLDDPGYSPPAGDVDPEQLRLRAVSVLRSVYDPELPVNVYDLGLVYRLEVDDTGNVQVDVTLTAPGCPVADHILREVHEGLRRLDGALQVSTRLVWEPPWTPDRMSQAVRLELGLL
jgi:FeS assembly SUF system protein